MSEKKKMNKENKDLIRKIFIVLALILLVFSGYNLAKEILDGRKATETEQKLVDVIVDTDNLGDDEGTEEKYAPITLTDKSYQELKNINNDFIGWLSFYNGKINQPIVLTNNNEYYLTKNFFKENLAMGTAFLDKDQTINSRNMTMYGHLVYRDESLVFGPLTKLTSKANYESFRYFSFTTGTEKRDYEVVAVFHYDINEDTGIPYYVGNMSDASLRKYVESAKAKSFYNIDASVDGSENLISLQTCVRNKKNLLLVVVGKEISRSPLQ